MSARLLVSSLAGVAVLGGAAAATFALVGSADAAPSRPTIEKASATSVVVGTPGTDTFTFTATMADDSGIKGVKVLPWPKSSKLDPTAAEMEHAESATCKATSETTSVCTYTLPMDAQEDAAGMPSGTWNMAVLVTAEDGDTTYSAQATTFTVTHNEG
ncbi:DUF5707 domain-containing protein [Streptomyces sp. B93]|uniref:DUF5707 domain-containing protein n=1 Tax=Streptomyces sp. B93 TaxID=2824875 RepID=UPI001B38E8F7|nr:DUF5707 domain-containing protein [Streptomyces sp. B93]MBQ1089115.1 hypothetical protein [Streptomyces sp. B93]